MSLFSRHTVDVEEALRRADAGAVLIDVRQRQELRDGMARGALHIPLASLEQKMSQLRDRDVLVLCRSGNRSARAAAMLRRNGINALNVRGGMLAWARKDLPVQRRSSKG